MRRSLLNKLNLSKSLRQALVLFTLLILPSAAWGDAIIYSSENNNLYSLELQKGTASNLSLDNDNGVIKCNFENTGDAYIGFTNFNSTDLAGKTIRSIAVSAKKEITGDSGESKVYIKSNLQDGRNMQVEATDYYSYTFDYIETTNTIGVGLHLNFEGNRATTLYIKSITVVYDDTTLYDLWIGGRRVTNAPSGLDLPSDSVSAIGGDFYSVTFDPSGNKLTLSNIELKSAITSKLSNLVIFIEGENKVNTSKTSNNAIIDQTTSAEISFSTNSNEPGALTLFAKENYDVITGFTNSTSPAVNNGLVWQPTEVSGKITSATISILDYGLTIGGVAVTSANAGEGKYITGDNISGTNAVQFIPATSGTDATLTLSGATINGGIKWNSNDNLVIALNGENSITNDDGNTIEYTGQNSSEPTLTFVKAEGATSCKLTLTPGEGSTFTFISNLEYANGSGLYYIGGETTATITSTLLGGGSGTSADPFLIKNLNDLKNFAKYVNEGILTSEFVQLENTIDCSEIDNFEPIGKSNNPFIGTFDGNGETISNLTIEYNSGAAGLFSKIGEWDYSAEKSIPGSVLNLTLDHCSISNNNNSSGGIAGQLYSGTIENCSVINNSSIVSTYSHNPSAGGIVGEVNNNSKVYKCQVSNTTISSTTQYSYEPGKVVSGGIVGWCENIGVEIELCTVSNAIISSEHTNSDTTPGNNSSSYTIVAGGIFGYTNENLSEFTCTFKNNNIKESTISSFSILSERTYAGAIIGKKDSKDELYSLEENYYESSVTTKTKSVGATDFTTKSGNTQRGIGDGDDIPNQVMIAGTKKVTISATDLTSDQLSLGEDMESSYCLGEIDASSSQLKTLYVLPNNKVSLVVISENGYKPTFTLSNSVGVTPEGEYANGWTIKFDFEMPEDDVTATIAFAKDLESKNGEVFIYTLSTDQEAYAYTGEGIEPSISLTTTDPDNPVTVTLAKGTDYEIKDYFEVKEGVATPMYEEKDGTTTPKAPIYVGSYKISITGKGDYSGTRELEFSITKRAVNWSEDKWTSPEAKTDLKYTGADMELVTAATVPEGVTIKYYTKYSSEQFSDYDYSESQDEEWSEEVPTGKEIGYYAVFYKVEGGDNYQDWGPCEVGIAVNIDKDEVTITAENQEVTYNATAQEYDISKVVVDNENAKVVVTYYATAEDLEGGTALAEAPTNAGIYYVRVTLNEESQQHYVAEPADATFTINQLSLEGAEITLNYTELTYNGSEQTVSVTKVEVNGIVVDSDNYLVDDNKGTEAREYTVTVTAKPDNDNFKNNFVGSAEKVWKINHRTASATELGFESETQTSSTYYNPNESFNLPEGYVAYIITGVNGTEVLTTRVSYIPKGVAVLVEKGTSSDEATENITNTDLLPLKGTVEPLDVISITGGTVYVLYNGEFVKSTSGTIPGKRCYLLVATSVAAGTRSFSIDHGDGTTGIKGVKSDEVKGEKWTDDKWHDLQGRSIEKPTKAGLYIKNGKKVVIK